MKRLYVMLFSIVAMLISAGSAYAYQVLISVSSSTGDPVIGASYSVNGQEDILIGLDGTATLELTGTSTINVKAPGYESQSRTVSNSCHLDFSLIPSSSEVTFLIAAIKVSNSQVQITGQLVSASTGEGIFGQITNTSTSESWNTDFDGSFNFTIGRGTTVRFDSNGYQSVSRACNSSDTWLINMSEE